jgi:hypothetical protein
LGRCLRLMVAVGEKGKRDRNEKERGYMQEVFENML